MCIKQSFFLTQRSRERKVPQSGNYPFKGSEPLKGYFYQPITSAIQTGFFLYLIFNFEFFILKNEL